MQLVYQFLLLFVKMHIFWGSQGLTDVNLSLKFVELIIFFEDLSIEIQNLLIQDADVVVWLQNVRVFDLLTSVFERADLLVLLHDDVFD